jgi:hypothetical protein
MAKSALSAQQAAELERLRVAYVAETAKAAKAILATGMDAEQFAKADAAVRAIVRRIKDILGISPARPSQRRIR